MYQQFGVAEYWLFDPERDACQFLRLVGNVYQIAPVHGRFHSTAVPGFVLNIERVRRRFSHWRPG
jgi:Uma2 family endonuclease